MNNSPSGVAKKVGVAVPETKRPMALRTSSLRGTGNLIGTVNLIDNRPSAVTKTVRSVVDFCNEAPAPSSSAGPPPKAANLDDS
jgi:hypothetical protein